MEELIFEDYLKPNIGNQKDVSTIMSLVLKQISRGRFEIAGNLCTVIILLDSKQKTVILSNAIEISAFLEQVRIALPNEPSLDFLYEKMEEADEPLLICLKKYQDRFYKLGTEFENEYWYKFYSKTEIKGGMRELYQASWIDYEKQLENESIIHDELGVCGLWAMPHNMLFDAFNEECIEHYGDNLFILKPVPECRYINDGKEIIGDRFKVVKKYDLNSIKDVGELINYLVKLEKHKYDIGISELNEKINELESKNMNVSDNQKYLSIIISRYKQFSWLLLLIGIICGIIICGVI